MLERDIQAKIMRYCRNNGILAYKFASPARRGVPDLLLVFIGGLTVFIEVKTEKGRLTALQQRELRILTEQGCIAKVFHSFEDFIQWLHPAVG